MDNQNKWNEAFESGRDYEVMNRLLLKEVLNKAPKGTALDLGCGTGELACALAQNGYSVTGLDISDVAISKAKERASELNLEITFAQADLAGDWTPQLSDAKFNLITIKQVLAFIDDKDKFLDQVKSVMAEDGAVILQTPVIYKDEKYLPRMQNISIDSQKLDELLKGHFKNIELISQDYFELKGVKCTFLCEK